MTEGKISSTREHREAMATGCIWHEIAELAEFWHLLNTSYHCGGRGNEVSLVTPEGTTVVEVNKLVYQYLILQTALHRQKNGPFQSILIYPHRDGVFKDFYFSLIHLVIVVDELRNTFEPLSDCINEKLSSHCNKKGSNQVMADSPSVSGLAQIFCTG